MRARDGRSERIAIVAIRIKIRIRIGYLIAAEHGTRRKGNPNNKRKRGNMRNSKQIRKPMRIRKQNSKAIERRDDPSEINQSESKHTSKETLEPKQPHIPGDRIIRLLLVLFQIRNLHSLP